MTQLNEIDVAKKAVELADANPDFIYKAPLLVADNEFYFDHEDGTLRDDCGYEVDPEGGECKYLQENEDGVLVGSCLYGQALLATGMPIDELKRREETTISAVFGAAMPSEQSTLLRAMVASQTLQDGGNPWSKAIEPVKKALAEAEVTA